MQSDRAVPSAMERIARVLCSHDGHPEDAPMAGKPMWTTYIDEAQMILSAIREPNETMIVAGAEHDASPARDIYSSMIDMAITEGKQILSALSPEAGPIAKFIEAHDPAVAITERAAPPPPRSRLIRRW